LTKLFKIFENVQQYQELEEDAKEVTGIAVLTQTNVVKEKEIVTMILIVNLGLYVERIIVKEVPF